MKKLLPLVLALAGVAVLFTACPPEPPVPPESDPVTDPVDPPAPKPESFELECANSYDNYLTLETKVPAASGYNKFNIEWKYETSSGIQACVQLMNDAVQASATGNGSKEYSVTTVDCLAGAKYTAWENNKSSSKDCADEADRIQFYIQDSNYQAVAGKVFVKKAWLSAEGKNDLVIYEFKEEVPYVFDGIVDLTKLTGYDAAAGGLVKDFGEDVSSYNEAFVFTLSDLGLKEVGDFTKIEVIADVYKADGTKINLASEWGSRLMLKLFATEADHIANTAIKEEYNCGVSGQTIAGFTAPTDIFTINGKSDPIAKIVVTAITFLK